MKLSTNNFIDWLKAFVFAVLACSLFLVGLATSTKVHEWHLAQKNTCTVVAATEQDNK